MVDRRLTLRHLRTFIEVARQGGVGRAARTLHVTQPAVTQAVRELEEILAVALFHREGRRIRLTGAGEIFLRHAGTAMSAIRQGIESVTADDGGPPIRVGALPTVSARIMPAAVAALLREQSAPRLQIVTGANAVLLGQLRDGSLDLVVGRLAEPEAMVGFFFEHLYSEPVVFVVRPGHPLLAAGTDVLARLGEFPLLMPPADSIIRPSIERFFIVRGLARPLAKLETVSDSFGRAFVQAGDAIWVISEGVVANDLADGALAALPLDTGDTRGPVGLTMRTDTRPRPGFESAVLAIRTAAQPHAARGSG
jgi:LysR family pca operon transcriptional activator